MDYGGTVTLITLYSLHLMYGNIKNFVFNIF